MDNEMSFDTLLMIGILKSLKERNLLTEEQMNLCIKKIEGENSVKSCGILQRICRQLEIPVVHGTIGGWFGQVTTIFPGNDTLSLIYEEGSEVSQDAGNPSFTPAVIAGIQAAEAVKVLLGYEDVLQRKMLFVDLFTGNVHKVEL